MLCVTDLDRDLSDLCHVCNVIWLVIYLICAVCVTDLDRDLSDLCHVCNVIWLVGVVGSSRGRRRCGGGVREPQVQGGKPDGLQETDPTGVHDAGLPEADVEGTGQLRQGASPDSCFPCIDG